MSSTEVEIEQKVKSENKNAARDTRLFSMRKANEEVLRREFENDMAKNCREQVKNFGECAKKNDLMVVFRCRNECQKMNECMNKYINEEAFQIFLRDRFKS